MCVFRTASQLKDKERVPLTYPNQNGIVAPSMSQKSQITTTTNMMTTTPYKHVTGQCFASGANQ